MRDIAVVLIFFGALFLAFRRPYVAALLWVWIGLMNPHRLGWGFAYSFPFAMTAAAVLFLVIGLNPKVARFPKGGAVVLLLLLVGWMGITTVAAIFPEQSLGRYIEALKVLLMTLVVASVVRTRKEILGLIVVVAGSIAFFGIKGGVFTLLTGGAHRVWGPPYSVIEGNNELAVALIITVPLLYYLALQIPLLKDLPVLKRIPANWMRLGLYGAILGCLLSALGSHSRGALLAMLSMGAVLWWRSKAKLPLAMVAVALGVAAVVFMPPEWLGRMHTIETYQQDESAMGRINAWTMAFNIANDRITGAGFVTDSPLIYQRYAPNPSFVIVAHSIYFQMLGEHGYIGLLLYLAFWISTYRIAGRLVKLAGGKADLQWAQTLGSMGKVSLIGFAVGGAFLSLAYWDMPFYLMVFLLCAERLVKEELAASGLQEKQETASAMSPRGLKPQGQGRA